MNTLTRLAQGLGALLVVVGVLAGGPVALVWFGRLDALAMVDWSRIWTTPDDGTLVLGLITVIGWAAWAMAALSLLSEALASLSSGAVRLRFPGISVFAPASAVLITAIAGLVGGQLLGPAGPPASPLSGHSPNNHSSVAAHAAPAAVADEPAVERFDHTAPAAPATWRTHLVVQGDDLWSLAERYYGDGSRWREIAAANDTALIDTIAFLQPGTMLHIPDPGPRAAGPGEVVVEAGDTLSGLAAEHLGEAGRWPELVAANANLVGDPDNIEVGWRLALPGNETVAAAPIAADDSTAGQPLETVDTPVRDTPAPGESTPGGPDLPDRAGPPGDPALTTCEVPAEPPIDLPGAGSDVIDWTALPASIGGTLSVGLATAFAARRRQQLAGRPLGRRVPPLPPDALPASAALSSAQPDPTPLSATEVVLGETDSGPVTCDLMLRPAVGILGDGDDHAMATAIALSLAVTDGVQAVDVVVAGAPFQWLASLDEPSLEVLAEVSSGVTRIHETVAQRLRSRPPGRAIGALSVDPELADAWAPMVFVLAGPPPEPLPTALAEAGVACVVCGPLADADLTIALTDGTAHDLVAGVSFRPNLVDLPARRALDEMFAAANEDDYPPAPWWRDEPGPDLPTPLRSSAVLGALKELPVIATVESDHPVVNLLGPVELVGARGQLPSRAVKQCEEYCAWLLEHPGSGASAMAESLLVAETTRRSNMSRLRSWLGDAPDGTPYLPDAYTGRISLHPGVTSDWEQLQLYLSGGVNMVGDQALVHALGLVRGAPLADAAPTQWHWAEQLRADMISTIRDVGVVLARHAIAAGDLALAGWAVARALVAARDDQLLVATQIRIAHLSGDRAEVDRLVLQLTRHARAIGIDLLPEVVTMLQEAVEGRARLRRA